MLVTFPVFRYSPPIPQKNEGSTSSGEESNSDYTTDEESVEEIHVEKRDPFVLKLIDYFDEEEQEIHPKYKEGIDHEISIMKELGEMEMMRVPKLQRSIDIPECGIVGLVMDDGGESSLQAFWYGTEISRFAQVKNN